MNNLIKPDRKGLISLKACLALLLVVCMLLSGCTLFSFVPSQSEEAVDLPVVIEPIPDALNGDTRSDQNVRVALYYLSSDLQQFTPVSRVVKVAADDVLAERIVERLLEPSASADARSIAPEGTFLLSIEQAQGIATVNLSSEARGFESEQQLVWMRYAIANTLFQLEPKRIHYVNVLIDGMDESALSLPTGTLEMSDRNLTALYAEYLAAEERFLRDHSAPLERLVTLYFGSKTGGWLLPEVRKMRFESEDYVSALLSALMAGSSGEARGVFPASGETELLASPPEIKTTEDGLRLIHLSFAGDLPALMERDGLSMGQLLGALTLTMCRFVPEVNGIMIDIGGERVTQFENAGAMVSFPSGIMAPSDFGLSIGQTVSLYAASEDGRLVKVKRIIEPARSTSPRALIEEMIKQPPPGEISGLRVFPEGIAESDILGIRVSGDQITLNLSSNFYRCCQALSQTQERNLVYAMVNTLTELDGIKRVRFLVEGAAVDTLAQSINLSGALMRNPGLIVEAQSTPGPQ